jgi:hypothetical protein
MLPSTPLTPATRTAFHPGQAVYSHRLSVLLDRIYPEALELLKIAARAQHIEPSLRHAPLTL